MKTRHGACGRHWDQRGNATSHCGSCHETFTNLQSFDMHLRRDANGSWCVPPETLPLFTCATGKKSFDQDVRYWTYRRREWWPGATP